MVACRRNQSRRCAAHDEQRHEKGALPPDEVADAAEKERAERADDEAHGKCRQVGDERQRVVARRVEERRNRRGQAAEDVEVVPLDHGADG